MQNQLLILALCSTVGLLTGCGGSNTAANTATDSVDSSEGSDPVTDPGTGDSSSDPVNQPDPVAAACSPTAIKQWVTDTMRDKYLFYDQMPVLDQTAYATPEELVVAYRVAPDRWSRLTNQETDTRLFNEGRAFGLGYRTAFDATGALRFSIVRPGSPMAVAGVSRGDILESINSIASADFPDEWQRFFSGREEEPKPLYGLLLMAKHKSAEISN